MSLTLDDFDYSLPPELIAQAPLPQRSASRLLVVGAPLQDLHVTDLPQQLRAGDLLVMNDTRVLHARLYGQKDSGGQIEVLVERPLSGHSTDPHGNTDVLAQVRASKSPKPGTTLHLENAITVEVIERIGEFYRLRFQGNAVDLLEAHGRLPLPPYIEHAAGSADESRYQTVYAREKGSVAAPTAGLHFDEALLDQLKQQGVNVAHVTLHVGAGTFQPVRVHNIAEHKMHSERYTLTQATVDAIAHTKANGSRVVVVGTTTMRTLESVAQKYGELRADTGETDIFITPGFTFRVADMLMTNFHLPKSTLLMLVSAFAGSAEIRAAYTHAVAEKYRFFSYGDAMLLTRNPHAV
ncbi:MAG TPA: tRNA preQ1(34) S-adenosylmethionine ribosyltransferase-isomerase QueA [Rhodocyclaceae bacterium]|nr:tRNA preQ1(34) S-adenosylmethionine ribosyltransferase-isomerase QueA [Rhodocyclaceae bacterium]